MTRLLFLSFLSLGVAPAAVPANPPAAATTTPSPGASPLSPRTHERTPPPSLWDDSQRFVEDGGSNVGGWLAERRELLVAASVRNSYFWFSIVSFGLIALLTFTLYFERVSEHRKIWKATAAMTDLWNWALYADAQARQAIRTYNTHIDQCNRLADLEATGKALTGSGPDEEAKRVHGEMEALRREKAVLEQQLADKELAIQDLTTRVDDVMKQIGSGQSSSESSADNSTQRRVQAQLMEKVNQLSSRNQQLERDLEQARHKLARSNEGKAAEC